MRKTAVIITGERTNMAKMLRSKLFGYINDLDKDMERSHTLKKTDNWYDLAGA